jgi:hypothetical protein
MSEGNGGVTTFTFTISSSLPAPAGGITFDITTVDGTAHDHHPLSDDNDYVAASAISKTITSAENMTTFDVTVNGDTLVESDEIFKVVISNPSGGGATIGDDTGIGTIQNDDTPLVVISQLYGGGGNAGAIYKNDFVELFNRGNTTVNFALTNYSIQYIGATGTFGGTTAGVKFDLSSGTLAPGQYFLIQLSSGGANGIALPAADATGSIVMAATAGKVALVRGVTSLSAVTCPADSTIVDFVGYGSTANCFEGTGPTPAPSTTNAAIRGGVAGTGCTDTNNNATNFTAGAVNPHNTASPTHSCP